MYKSEKLALSLKHLIESGFWKANDKLPSLRQQAETSGFSLMTVMNAYQELEAQGLIYSQEKLGYFVTGDAHSESNPNSVILNEKIEINSNIHALDVSFAQAL
jgi:DNA-binding GntR family transcriptional regulator